MLDILYKVAAAVGAFFLAAGGLTAIALWGFKLLGERWVGNEFAKRLEVFKHEQQKEIEQVKFQINRLFDRATKLHQREFEVVPKAWKLLLDAYHRTEALTAALQSYPDLRRMGAVQRTEFIETCGLENWEKEELKASADMNKYYQDAIFWHRLTAARKDIQKSARYLAKNGIFITPSLKAKFEELQDVIWKTLLEEEINKRHNIVPRQSTAHDRFSAAAGEFKLLERQVQDLLWGPLGKAER